MSNRRTGPALEFWAGIECTVNRVGDRFRDQLSSNGHATRLDDLDRIAGLGVNAIRYPVLWERTAPDSLDNFQWDWPDERLNRLRELNITPIVGLLHHGSGPSYTSLLAPDFPEQLAVYARAVAERYPWVNSYTPVNEPLTTARFSGLYGHWYPHGKDDLTFARCLLNECKGTVLAMKAIREINPQAQLIQTEDLGKIYSTPLLQYQAALENERRWVSFDLLCGKLKPDMPMWKFFVEAGISEESLTWFLDNPCPPDVIGINHYLTSDRYLDENYARYPVQFRGGNGVHEYADEAAIRVNLETYSGIADLLTSAYERFGLPLAVTEAHLGCTREEQMRWLNDIWQTCQRLQEKAVDIRAVTAWSLLGSYDWHCLLTREENFYESGVFDMRETLPRATALVPMIQSLSQGKPYPHPVLESPGWWHRADRFHYPERPGIQSHAVSFHTPTQDCLKTGVCNVLSTRPILIVGATGTLGKSFARICDVRGLPYYLLSRQELDIRQPDQVESVLQHLRPWAVINAAGFVRVDDAETELENCWADNVTGPVNLATACANAGVPLVTFSSDLVFCGMQSTPYLESHPVNPLNVYGRSKAAVEQEALAILPSALVIRTSAFFSPWDVHNFLTISLSRLISGQTVEAPNDVFISPTYVPDLVNCSLDLLIDGESGLWHLSNHTPVSWSELALMAADQQGLKTSLIRPVSAEQFAYRARRPFYSVLGTERCKVMPSLENALERYLNDVELDSKLETLVT